MATYYTPVTTTPEELITLNEAKAQLKLDADYVVEDDLILSYIDAAVIAAENYTVTSLYLANYLVKQTAWVNNYAFTVSPVNSIVSVKYVDENGDEQTLDTDQYELVNYDKYQAQILFKDESTLPNLSSTENLPVRITIATGHTATSLPKAIKQAILLMIGSFYENRQDSVEALPKASQNLLRKYIFHY